MKRETLPEFDSANTLPVDARRPWRRALPVLSLLLLWILAWYASTARGMAEIWARSDTFAHGFIVPLIVLWLVWRMRADVAALTPRPAWWGLGLLAATGFGWLLGELAAVNALSQLALTTLVVLTVITVLGTTVARKLAFPLAFLFFAVPIGEFMMPRLIEWTADFTVLALRWTGIPVYREGQQFIIPSGRWSVVEACSGLRYLVASFMIGTLFAYLSYRSFKRRLLFVGVSILVPIIANWLRAYMIVMLGHLSDNKLAVGVDHLIYGWLFFGLVIAIMFWVGGRWREDHLPVAVAPLAGAGSQSSVPANRWWAVAALAAFTIVVWKLSYWAIESSDASAPPQLASLEAIGGWHPGAGAVAPWQPSFENPPAELRGSFHHGEQTVGVFIGYYRNQNFGRKLVSSENVLVKSDDSAWLQVGGGSRDTSINGEPLAVRVAELRGPNEQRLLAWHWYWINGRLTTSAPLAKAYTAASRLQGRGDDSAVIVVYARRDQPGDAEQALDAFIRSAGPAIDAALRRTRDAR